MNHAIHFKTSLFDVSKEKVNPINPIYGISLLEWLKEELKGKLEITEPDAEDWGWYSELVYQGSNYLIGASAYKVIIQRKSWNGYFKLKRIEVSNRSSLVKIRCRRPIAALYSLKSYLKITLTLKMFKLDKPLTRHFHSEILRRSNL